MDLQRLGRNVLSSRDQRTAHLDYYATKFNTVEINATFYRLPLPTMVKGWHDRSPENFIFAVKGSRFITQMKKLNVERESIKVFFDRAKLLKEKCGPILWQLPPNFGFNGERLVRFFKIVPKRFRHAVEFRHPSWYEHEETFEILRQNDAAHVAVSSLRMPMNLNVTGDFIYIRFHGLEHGAAHDYTRKELQPWAEHCLPLSGARASASSPTSTTTGTHGRRYVRCSAR